MKKITLSLVAAALSFASFAQDAGKKIKKDKAGVEARHHKGGPRGHELADKVNLNDAQKSQMKIQKQELRKQLEEVKNSNLSNDQKQARRKEILEQRREQMKGILTPEQKQKVKELKKDKVAKKKDGKGEGRGNRKDKMQQELGLSTDQSSRIEAINKSFRTEVKSIRANADLSQDQKKEQVKALQQKHKEELRSLLTTEQQNKLKDRVKNHPRRSAVK